MSYLIKPDYSRDIHSLNRRSYLLEPDIYLCNYLLRGPHSHFHFVPSLLSIKGNKSTIVPIWLFNFTAANQKFSQQQQNSDPWTNSNQSPWSGGNALAVAREQADVLSSLALIFRAHAQLEDAMVALETLVRQFLIEFGRSRLAGKKWRLLQRWLRRHRLRLECQ